MKIVEHRIILILIAVIEILCLGLSLAQNPLLYMSLVLIIFIFIVCIILDRDNILYIFIALYPILPEYFAINISETLPLITSSRICLIIFILYSLLFYRRNQLVSKYLKSSGFGNYFIIYIIGQILVFIPHYNSGDSIKSLLSALLEKVIFLVIVARCVDSKDKLINCIRILVLTSGIVFTLGIIETYTGQNLAYLLDTAGREMLQANYNRFDTIRAEFTFGHPIALGVYAIVLLPFVMYFLEKFKGIYVYIFIVGLICLLLTISRGPILVFIIVFIIMLANRLPKQRRIYYPFIMLAAILFIGMVVYEIESFNLFKNIINSTFNVFGLNLNVSGKSGNEQALLSRLSQLSMISQVLNGAPLSGFGAGVLKKELLLVTTAVSTHRAISFDIAYLVYFVNYGLIGLLVHVILYCKFFIASVKYSKKHDCNNLNNIFKYIFLSYYLVLFSVAELTTTNLIWLIYSLFIAYNAIISADNNISNKEYDHEC